MFLRSLCDFNTNFQQLWLKIGWSYNYFLCACVCVCVCVCACARVCVCVWMVYWWDVNTCSAVDIYNEWVICMSLKIWWLSWIILLLHNVNTCLQEYFLFKKNGQRCRSPQFYDLKKVIPRSSYLYSKESVSPMFSPHKFCWFLLYISNKTDF